MPPSLATLVYSCLILGLFWLDRAQNVRTSRALWIPTIWLAIACSRPVGAWLDQGTVATVQQVADGSPADRMVDIVLITLGLIALLGRKRQAGRILRANWPILLFLLYGAISLVWSDFPFVALKRWIKAWGDIIMILIVLTDPERHAAMRRTFARLAYVLLPLSLLLIKYYPLLGMGWNPWTGAPVYQGVTLGKNYLGMICLCLGLVTLWRFFEDYGNRSAPGRYRRMIVYAVVLGIILRLFQIMDSMTSLNSFIMAATVLAAANLRIVARRPVIIHILVVSMLALSASIVFLSFSPDLLKAMGRNPTLTERTFLWNDILTQVHNPLFGTGFDSFWVGPRLDEMWRLDPFRPNEAHDGYLEVFINLGWVGVALLAIVIVTGYKTAFLAWCSGDPAGGLKIAFVFAGLTYNFTEAAFFKTQAACWLFILLAIVAVPQDLPQEAGVPQGSFRIAPGFGQLHEQSKFL